MARIGLNGSIMVKWPMTNRVKVCKKFYGLRIETNNFSFEDKYIPGLESTKQYHIEEILP